MKLLTGLTIVLLDTSASMAPVIDRAQLIIRKLRQHENHAEMRFFTVGVRLIELSPQPEEHAGVAATDHESRIEAAINRLNILKPARFLVITDYHERLGRPRPRTYAYVRFLTLDAKTCPPEWIRIVADDGEEAFFMSRHEELARGEAV